MIEVIILATGKKVAVNESFALRLYEQGRAAIAPKKPAAKKTEEKTPAKE